MIKKYLLGCLSFLLALILCFYYIFPDFSNLTITAGATYIEEQREDYERFFNEFEESELVADEETNSIRFSGLRWMDAELWTEEVFPEDIYQDGNIPVRYSFSYCADTNEFWLTVTASVPGDIIDYLPGVSFLNDEGNIDVAFDTDDGVVYLSELERC